MKRIDISIGNVSIAIESVDDDLDLDLLGASRRFGTESVADPSMRITARWGEPRVDAPGDLLFDSGGVWTLFADGASLDYRLRSPTYGSEPYKTARMSRDLTSGEVVLRRDAFARTSALYPLEYPLDEILVTHRLARDGGVEMHGCGLVAPDGRGLLFVAQSGGGKTTTARLWIRETDAVVLSDDRIIVRHDGEAFRMWGTPWHGEEELAEPRSARLDRIFLLRQSSGNEITDLPPANMVARLVGVVFPPFHDPTAMESTMDSLERITRGVPCSELGFRPDSGAVQLVLETD